MGFFHGSVPGSSMPPVNLTVPVISGALTVGQVLTTTNGTWSQCTPSCTYTYRWYDEGFVIGGATAQTYTLASSDLSGRISVDVIATNSFGPSPFTLSAVSDPVISTTVRYVSFTDGLDTNNGTTSTPGAPNGPWKTIAKVNGASLAAGSSVLFKRGDTWRDQLSPSSSGTAGNPIVFDAYGSGAKPLILGSTAASATGDWTLISGSKWKSTASFPPPAVKTVTFSGSPGNVLVTWSGAAAPANPVNGRGVVFYTAGTLPTGIVLGQGYFIINASGSTSNISATPGGAPVTISSAGSGTHTAGVNGFPSNNSADIGNLVFTSAGVIQTGTTTYAIWTGQSDTNLTTQGQWYFNISDWKVHVFSTTNPATAMPGLELAVDTVVLYPLNRSYNTFQNLEVKYGGASGAIVIQSSHIIIRDMAISWIGGGNVNGDNVRFGDCIDIELTGTDYLFERNLLVQCYDSGLTVQPLTSGSPVSNITWRNNIIQNGTQGSLAILTFGASITTLSVYNNTIYNLVGWSEGQRWGAGGASEDNQRFGVFHGGGATPIPTAYNSFNNAFAGLGTSCSINAGGFPYTLWQGAGNMLFDYNLWSRQNGTATIYCSSGGNQNIATWAPGDTPPQEVHGIIDSSPQFTNPGAGNFTPVAGSPLINTGTNLFGSGVVWDYNRLPRPTSGNFTIGAIQIPYVGYDAKAVHFDGTTALFSEALQGNYAWADTQGKFSTVFWIKNFQPTVGGSDFPMLWVSDPIAYNQLVAFSQSPTSLFMQETGIYGTNGFAYRSDDISTAPTWQIVMISGDGNQPMGSKGAQVYIGDTPHSGSYVFDGLAIGTSSTLPAYTPSTPFIISADGYPGDTLIADIADLRIMPGVKIDFSNVANRRLFVSATGKPVDPAIATAALGAPAVFLSGDKDHFSNNTDGLGGSFPVRKSLFANGLAAPGSIVLGGAVVGDSVVHVFNGDASTFVESDFESVITVAGHIQQTGATNYSANTLGFFLSGGALSDASSSPSD